MIIVKPNGGLGNRMRVIHAALLLARLHNQNKITVLWKKDNGLNADFYKLFEPIPNVLVEQQLGLMSLKFYGNKYRPGFKFVDDALAIARQYDKNYWREVSGNFIINSCIDFLSHQEDENLYSLFMPVLHIREKIDALKDRFSEYTIGIQIRRTDNRPAIAKSPMEGFIRAMNRAVDEQPLTDFFLCTDDPKCEQQLKEIFGNRIIIQENKKLSRNSVGGIESAMVDMFALSSTKYIIGSFGSSFGEVAAAMGRIRFDNLVNDF